MVTGIHLFGGGGHYRFFPEEDLARMQDTFLSQLREQVRGDEELTRKLAELVAKAGQEALDAES